MKVVPPGPGPARTLHRLLEVRLPQDSRLSYLHKSQSISGVFLRPRLSRVRIEKDTFHSTGLLDYLDLPGLIPNESCSIFLVKLAFRNAESVIKLLIYLKRSLSNESCPIVDCASSVACRVCIICAPSDQIN